MTSKSKQVIMAAVGAYLVYTGVSLVRETIAGEPKNQILFILAGVFFAIFGLATIVHNIRIIVKATKADPSYGSRKRGEFRYGCRGKRRNRKGICDRKRCCRCSGGSRYKGI